MMRYSATVVVTAIAVLGSIAAAGCGARSEGAAVLPTIAIDDTAYSGELVLDPASRTLYAVTSSYEKGSTDLQTHTMSVIDLSTNTVRTRIALPAYADDIAIDSTTRKIYVVSALDRRNDTGLVTVVDGATDTVTARIPVGKYSLRVAVNETTHTAYVLSHSATRVEDEKGYVYSSTVSVIPPKADTIGRPMPATVGYAADIAADPGSTTVYVADDDRIAALDAATGARAGTIPLSSGAEIALLDPDTRTLFAVTDSGEIAVVDLTTRQITRRLTGFGKKKDAEGISFSYSATADFAAHTVYTAANGAARDEDAITAIDTSTGKVTRRHPLPDPYSLALDPTTHTLYVLSHGTLMIYPSPGV